MAPISRSAIISAAILALLILFGIVTVTLVGLTYDKVKNDPPTSGAPGWGWDKESECCRQDDRSRHRAEKIGREMLRTLSQVPGDPTGASRRFAHFFEERGGVYSTVMGNHRGRHNISHTLRDYGLHGNDTALVITPERMYWDFKLSTLTIEAKWAARTTAPRWFFNNQFHPHRYPANTSYEQDDAIIIRFNCEREHEHEDEDEREMEVVYYRDYFSPLQRVSTFTTDYPHVCKRCEKKEHREPHRPSRSPTQPPIIF